MPSHIRIYKDGFLSAYLNKVPPPEKTLVHPQNLNREAVWFPKNLKLPVNEDHSE